MTWRSARVRLLGGLLMLTLLAAGAAAQEIPELTQPVNDFANVIEPSSERELDMLIRALQQASGDVVIVATVQTFQPYADLREYAVKMFENRGRGIGRSGQDNGLLVVLAVDDRQVWVEVGYDLEEFITDGFAGDTSRNYMVPAFRTGDYGAGLVAGVRRIVTRIAERRNVTLQGVRTTPSTPNVGSGQSLFMALFVLFMVINAIVGRTRRGSRRRWGGGPWSGWNSGVGPFGGGLGGGFGGRGGGFGGGFGGFGGGRSGGGGGGGGW